VSEEPRLGPRALRAIALVSTGVLAIAVIGALELRSSAPAPPARPVVSGGVELSSASFGDADHGAVTVLARPRGGGTYLTADGGRTWTPSTEENVLFSDPRHAIATARPGSAHYLRVTADGGRTWTDAQGQSPNDVAAALPSFVDHDHGWLLTYEARSDPTGPLLGLWRTSDAGRTWVRLPGHGIPVPAVAYTAAFLDGGRGAMIVGLDKPDGSTALLLTRDGGDTWFPAALPAPPVHGGRVFAELHVVGGRLLAWYSVTERPGLTNVASFTSASVDGGLTWRPPTAGPVVLQPQPMGFRSVQVDDGRRLLLLDDRRLWVSDDLGASWYARVAGVPSGFRAVGLVGARSALFAAALRTDGPLGTGLPQALLRSTDGGARWVEVRLPAPG
jgi:photosystem II stability/assembly factor-like uncharacterized protein